MIWDSYKVDSEVERTTENIRLWQTENGLVEIGQGALAVQIKLGDKRKGFVFHGQGRLLLDAIVQTEEGAVGESVEKQLVEPFLMLGNLEEIQKYLTNSNEDDFRRIGYEGHQAFVDKAEELCREFLGGRVHGHVDFGDNHGLIFAFPTKAGKFDILLANGPRVVYKTPGVVFILNEDKVVLKSRGEVVVSDRGKSVIVTRGRSVVFKG